MPTRIEEFTESDWSLIRVALRARRETRAEQYGEGSKIVEKYDRLIEKAERMP